MQRNIRFLWLLLLIVIPTLGYGLFRYRDSILSVVRVPAVAADVPTGGGRGRGNRGAGLGTPTVAVVTARKADLPVYLRGLGSVAAYSNVTVRSRIDGELNRVAFQEGQFVNQ